MPYIGNTTNSNMSELLRRSILNASCEGRLKVGLDHCVEHLYSCDPYKVLAVALTDASADIITQTILETFCYEHRIPFCKIDSNLLKRFLKPEFMQKLTLDSDMDNNSQDPYCALLLKPDNMSNYSDEVSLVTLINESELNNETLVILHPQGSPDRASNDQIAPNSNVAYGT